MKKDRIKTEGKKLLAFTMSMLVFVSTIFVPLAFDPPAVYAAHWADNYLNKLAGQGVLRGDQNGNFQPDRNITRAEFAAMLNRAFGFQQNLGSTFTDVPKEAWYADDISFASYQGYLQGTGDGNANPGSNLTREEAVTMLCRALKIEPEAVDTLNFADSKDFSSWSKGNINAAAKKNMLSGYPDSTFKPKNYITRGEVAKILSTLAGEIVNQPTQAYLGYVDGNVTLSKSGAGLRNTTITGDLYITEGVQTGYIFLDGVTVLGNIIISGAGESHTGESNIILTDCNINNIVVDVGHEKLVSLLAQGGSAIRNTLVKSKTYIQDDNNRNSAFKDIQLKGPSGTKLDLAGDFAEVKVLAAGNILNLNRGNIEKLTVAEDGATSKVFLEKKTNVDELYIDGKAEVTGTGTIGYVSIGVSGAIIDQVPDEIILRPGVTASIGGKEMNYLDAERENASPKIMSGYPEIKDIAVTAASGQVKTNKPGTVYWVVKDAADDTPTYEEMLDPKNAQNIIVSGNLPSTLTNVEKEEEISAKLSGLKSGGSYELYVMLVDSKDKRSSIRSESFTTLDKTAPTFVSGYPKYKALYIAPASEGAISGGAITDAAVKGEHRLEFEVVPSKNCTVYWAILPEKSVAATPENFYNQKVAGALQKGTLSALENEVSVFDIKNLGEYTNYDVYIGLKDASNNQSPVMKVTIRTKDATAPEFKKPYPRTGTIQETSVQIEYMTNEATSLYWAAFTRGAKFPPGLEDTGTGTTSDGSITSILSTEEAKQAVVTGNSAVKFGKTTTTADTPGMFLVSGLKAETTYDLYLMLEDVSKNRNPVYKMEITTKDDIPPTAEMLFDMTRISAEGNPPVGSDITIRFSEPVYAGNEAAKTVLGGVTPVENIKNYIQLYDLSQNPRIPVDIDFSKVKFSEELGYTTATFSTTGSGTSEAALKLSSGGRYYFELTGIRDMTGNPMKPNQGTVTRLTEFTMMAPFVNLKKIDMSSEMSKKVDIMFEVKPNDNVRDAALNKYYDNVLQADRKIQFVFTDGQGVQTGSAITMEPGRFYTMQRLIQDTLQCEYAPFKDLETNIHGMVITQIEGNDNRDSWNGSVNVTVSGISGGISDMQELAANGVNGNLSEYLSAHKDATLVSDPGHLGLVKYFEDVIPPAFIQGYPTVGAGDTNARVSVMTDKPATIYYLITPRTAVDSPMFPDPSNPKRVPMSQEQLMSGGFKPAGSKWGSFRVENAGQVVTEIIRDLSASEEYYIFYLAKGTKPSEIGWQRVETEAASTPRFKEPYPQRAGQGPGVSYVTVRFEDASAEVYWVAYPVGQFPGTNSPTREQITGEEIGSGASPVDSGSKILTENEEWRITIKNLKEGQFYDFFVVAKNPLGETWTEIREIRKITASDSSTPYILSATTTIGDYTQGNLKNKYDGVVTVIFSEPLSYVSDSYGTWGKLTDYIVQTQLNCAFGQVTGVTTKTGDPSTNAINWLQIKFTGSPSGDAITFPYIVGDGVNRSGYLKMVLVETRTTKDGVTTYDAVWDVKFVDRL